MSDGLVSNVALTLGVAGAHAAPAAIRLTGLAALVAGACSMACGEYLSTRAQGELLRRELDLERAAHIREPDVERAELERLYVTRGLAPEIAAHVATVLMADPDVALTVHAREELGLDPARLGSPKHASAASFVAFALGAAVPLAVWCTAPPADAPIAVIAVAVTFSALLGLILGLSTGRSPLRFVARQVLLSALAAGATFAVAHLVGIGGVG